VPCSANTRKCVIQIEEASAANGQHPSSGSSPFGCYRSRHRVKEGRDRVYIICVTASPLSTQIDDLTCDSPHSSENLD
jgi:hypothetical protein